jgi:hypothetical protein
MSRWMGQTRSQLFGARERAIQQDEGLGERTPLVRQGSGVVTVRRDEGDF